MIDPNDFVITRKRKKYKFAKFANASNCFEFEEWKKQPVDVIEVGAGTGLFSVELAALHPEKSFVAVDVKADRLQKGAYAAIERGLTNISFVRARADQLDQLFRPHSVEAIWVTFADPFPKKRSAGRRMTHPTYLVKYALLLRQDRTLNRGNKSDFSGLYIKHDNPEFFNWSLEQLIAESWHIMELCFDLHESDLQDDYKIMTSYEKRWIGEERTIGFVRAIRVSR